MSFLYILKAARASEILPVVWNRLMYASAWVGVRFMISSNEGVGFVSMSYAERTEVMAETSRRAS